MNRLLAAVLATNALLIDYIAIHDEIFSGSTIRDQVRKVIPIPGLFKPIPFATLNTRLSDLRAQLLSIRSDLEAHFGDEEAHRWVGEPENLPGALLTYQEALNDAMRQLEEMSGRLAAKANGDGGYGMRDYRHDVGAYQKSVSRYAHLGALLNRAVDHYKAAH